MATDVQPQPSISWRESIRWLPDPPHEPTSTLVLTSRQKRFVDIRVLKPQHADEPELPNEGGPLSRLDWAFAGTATSTALPNGNRRCEWAHWVDSRAAPWGDEAVRDEGEMQDLGSGRALETGKMVNPAMGQVGGYEEVWVDEEGGGGNVVLMLEGKGEGEEWLARGVVVRVGGWCQGILKVMGRDENGAARAEVSVERWREGKDGWKRVVKIGRLFIPCAATWSEVAQVGTKVTYGEYSWQVIESD